MEIFPLIRKTLPSSTKKGCIKMEKVFFIESGMGVDLHGQDITKACVRACRRAIGHNSMPGLRSILPNEDFNEMKVHIKLAVPCDKELIDVDQVKNIFPYGQKTLEIVDGGLATSSGVILADKGDKNDLMFMVIAVVQVGY